MSPTASRLETHLFAESCLSGTAGSDNCHAGNLAGARSDEPPIKLIKGLAIRGVIKGRSKVLDDVNLG
jgi:hypothetical protein